MSASTPARISGTDTRPSATALAATDWSERPCAGLGRAMARRDVDLATALDVFFRGGPERFNYLPKPHVPADYRPVARHLDNICLRINSGFYLPAAGVRPECRDALGRWLAYQRADRDEGRCGRWVLDEAVLAPLIEPSRRGPAPAPDTPPGTMPGKAQATKARRLLRAMRAALRALPRPGPVRRARK